MDIIMEDTDKNTHVFYLETLEILNKILKKPRKKVIFFEKTESEHIL